MTSANESIMGRTFGKLSGWGCCWRIQRLHFLAFFITALVAILASNLGFASTPTVEEDIAQIGALRVQGRFEAALEACHRLDQRLRSEPTAPDWYRGDVRRTIATLQEILARPLKEQQSVAEADSLTSVLEEMYREDRYEEGLALAEEQLATRRRILGSDNVETWESRNAVAMMLDGLGRADSLVQMEQAVVDANRRLLEPDHPALENSLNNLAALLDARGRLADAEPIYREALVIVRRREREDPAGLATTLNNLGTNLHEQGKLGEAEQYLREARKLRLGAAASDPVEVAQVENNIGALYIDRGDYTGALVWLRRAAARTEATPNPNLLEQAAVLQNIGNANYYLGQYVAAERSYRQAQRMREKASGPGHPRTAHLYVNLAATLHRLRRNSEAESLLTRAGAVLRATYGSTHPEVVWCLKQLGELQLATGRTQQAESTLTLAASAFDLTRLLVNAGDNQARFLNSPYPALAVAELQLGRGELAWNATERALARALADVVMFSGGVRRDSVDRERERSLRFHLDDAQREVRRIAATMSASASPSAHSQLQLARNAMEQIEAEWALLERELDQKGGINRGQVYSLEQVQSRLASDEALIGWLADDPQSQPAQTFGYAIRATGPVRWVALDSSLAAIRKVRGAESLWVANVRVGRDATRESRIIFQRRLEPLIAHLEGVRHVIVVPGGDMLGLPIEALEWEDSLSLGARAVVSYVPSATLFAWRRSQLAVQESWVDSLPRVLAVCDPPFNARQLSEMGSERQPSDEVASHQMTTNGHKVLASRRSMRDADLRIAWQRGRRDFGLLPRLQDSRLEADALVKFAAPGSLILTGPEASEATLQRMARKDSLAEFQVLHFATHALVDDSRPELSALVLSQVTSSGVPVATVPGAEDGAVSVREILATWHLDADLTVLSACSTGLGKKLAGEGYIGLARAFMQVGARSLLVSLWDVDDQSTALLMQRFYENWLGSPSARMSKAQALHEAKRWVRGGAGGKFRSAHDDPYYWAGFVLVGE